MMWSPFEDSWFIGVDSIIFFIKSFLETALVEYDKLGVKLASIDGHRRLDFVFYFLLEVWIGHHFPFLLQDPNDPLYAEAPHLPWKLIFPYGVYDFAGLILFRLLAPLVWALRFILELDVDIESFDILFTNLSSMFFIVAYYSLLYIIVLSCRGTWWFSRLYTFLYTQLMLPYVGDAGKRYFPFFFYMFFFIPSSNFIGLVPNVYSITGNLAVALFLSLVSRLGIFFVGLWVHGISFFSAFVPSKMPYVLVPFLVLVELISYIIRIASLALRLFANILSGHLLLDTISMFLYYTAATATAGAGYYAALFGALFALLLCVTLLSELIIAVLQAYIFVVLSVIYLNDVLALHA